MKSLIAFQPGPAAIFILAVLGGCAGGFRQDADFYLYVDHLRLAEIPYANAIGLLVRDKFTCAANSDPKLHPVPSTHCVKSWSGGKSYTVWLQPSHDDTGKTIVEPSISIVVA